MNKPYTPEELAGKFVCCFVIISGKRPVLDCVRQVGGPHDNQPFLYPSIAQAKSDGYFSPVYDEVISADEYFRRIKSNNQTVSKS